MEIWRHENIKRKGDWDWAYKHKTRNAKNKSWNSLQRCTSYEYRRYLSCDLTCVFPYVLSNIVEDVTLITLCAHVHIILFILTFLTCFLYFITKNNFNAVKDG